MCVRGRSGELCVCDRERDWEIGGTVREREKVIWIKVCLWEREIRGTVILRHINNDFFLIHHRLRWSHFAFVQSAKYSDVLKTCCQCHARLHTVFWQRGVLLPTDWLSSASSAWMRFTGVQLSAQRLEKINCVKMMYTVKILCVKIKFCVRFTHMCKLGTLASWDNCGWMSWNDWRNISRQVVCEYVSLMGSHPMPWQQSQFTPTSLGQRFVCVQL